MPNKFFDRNWWKDFVVAILATTVSIVLTFGTSKLIERNNQKKERKLTALKRVYLVRLFTRRKVFFQRIYVFAEGFLACRRHLAGGAGHFAFEAFFNGDISG